MNIPKIEGQRLHKTLGASQFFTLAFGAIVGVSWIVLLGVWLDQAGPIGGIVAFLCGLVVISSIALCYAEMASVMPVSGGEVAYAYEVFGLPMAYVVGWTLVLIDIVVVSYMCIASAWILDFLIPGIQGPVLYTFHKNQVHAISLFVALLGIICLTSLNYRGVKSATVFQDVLTYGKLIVSSIFIVAGLCGGHIANLHPFFRESNAGISWHGLLTVFVTTLWFYGGFNNVPQLMEEKASGTSLKLVGQTMILSVGIAAVFYCAVILSAAMAIPWQALVSEDLPAATVFRIAFHSEWLVRTVLLAGLLGTFTAANSCFIAGTRLLFALGRAGIVSRKFASVHSIFGSPVIAVLFVGAVAFGGTFLDRGGILPIVNIGATCFAIAYGVTCLGVIRLRQTQPGRTRPYRVPGGLYTAGFAALSSGVMLIISLYQPYQDTKGSFSTEWIILLIWASLGAAFWIVGRKSRNAVCEIERHKLICGEPVSSLKNQTIDIN